VQNFIEMQSAILTHKPVSFLAIEIIICLCWGRYKRCCAFVLAPASEASFLRKPCAFSKDWRFHIDFEDYQSNLALVAVVLALMNSHWIEREKKSQNFEV